MLLSGQWWYLEQYSIWKTLQETELHFEQQCQKLFAGTWWTYRIYIGKLVMMTFCTQFYLLIFLCSTQTGYETRFSLRFQFSLPKRKRGRTLVITYHLFASLSEKSEVTKCARQEKPLFTTYDSEDRWHLQACFRSKDKSIHY